MSVRKINQNEIQAFASIPPSKDTFSGALNRWLEEGTTKLDWCHVFEEDFKMIGRMVYAAYDQDLEISSVLMTPPQHELFAKRVEESMMLMKGQGFEQITYHLYDNRPHYEAYLNAFTQAGYKVTQQKKSFIFSPSDESHTKTNRLSFKSLREVDALYFLEIFESVTEGTLDRDDLDCVAQFGSREAAVRYINQLKEIDYTEDWWCLAYDGDTCIGLVVAQRFSDTEGAINYLGVLPRHRGKGYSKELILQGLHLMEEGGIDEIIADIDENNHPLDRLLTDLKFELTSTLYVLKAML